MEVKKDENRKRLAVFLDGTWNAVGDNTNVWRLRSLCKSTSDDGRRQIIYYDIGVNGFIGGAFGKGLQRNITDAYEWLIENYAEGDEIFIFGFSRGAFTARSLAGLIAKCGLIERGAPLGVGQLYDRYKRDDHSVYKIDELIAKGELPTLTREQRWVHQFCRRAEVTMVGVWDTVGALGVPAFSIPGISRKTFGFLETGLRRPIKHGFHAIAIDENRRAFSPTLWTINTHEPDGSTTPYRRPIEQVEQRWFVGAHGNVGGGYADDPMPAASLRWIMRRAAALKFSFHREVDVEDLHGAKVANSFAEFAGGAYSWLTSKHNRPIDEELPVDEHGRHANVNETIDGTVFDKWRTDSWYRPDNLKEWARRKKVQPAELSGPRLAADPTKVVAD